MESQDSRRILIIDDNESIHADFRKILSANAPLTVEVESAAAALFDEPAVSRPANVG